ncbi:MAG: hypothetical protein HY344_01875 [Candidatus Levybacteria bacterium]|nr:hypothetical protein [Candidatus Levybacteria bacterium]
MTDRGTPTPENVANSPRRRVLTVANGLIVTGTLVIGGVFADTVVRPMLENGLSNSPASTLVYKYEHAAVALGKEGKIAQLPQEFDSQQVASAYQENDAETSRRVFDAGALIAGTVVLGIGASKLSRRNR